MPYYWRVRANNAEGPGDWSETRTFTFLELDAPTLISPADVGVVTDETPELSWSAVTGALTYQVQLATENTFAAPVEDEVQVGLTFTPAALDPDETYYWRVRAITNDVLSSWSVISSFTSFQYLLLAKTLGTVVQYLPLVELSGTAALDYSDNGFNGVYSGVALDNADGPGANMGRAALWDGVADYCNIYSAGLAADFPAAAGTVAIWFKVSAVGVWTDATQRRLVTLSSADASSRIWMRRSTTNNRVDTLRVVEGTTKTLTHDDATPPTGWTHMAFTWDQVADEVKLYIDGVQTGATQTGIGIWGDVLGSIACCIGAANTSGGAPWSGWLQHYILYGEALAQPAIAILATAL